MLLCKNTFVCGLMERQSLHRAGLTYLSNVEVSARAKFTQTCESAVEFKQVNFSSKSLKINKLLQWRIVNSNTYINFAIKNTELRMEF